MSERDVERSVSQTVRAQLALRDMILSGRLRPGERISELQAVDITGASRTPVRLALVRLEDEGLLQAIPSGGFMVKAFTERDILDSIELRGTHTYGMTVCDARHLRPDSPVPVAARPPRGEEPNAEVAVEVNANRFWELFLDVLTTYP